MRSVRGRLPGGRTQSTVNNPAKQAEEQSSACFFSARKTTALPLAYKHLPPAQICDIINVSIFYVLTRAEGLLMMTNNEFERLLNENLDILKEIGNIGMGHTSTALSQLLGMKVTMAIPEVVILDTRTTAEYLDLISEDTHGVALNLQGESKGIILLIVGKQFAVKIINFFFQSDLDTIDHLDEMSLSVIQEIGNITAGAYCNSLASMTDMFIDISTPSHCPNLVARVLQRGDGSDRDPDDKILVINNHFYIEQEEYNSNFLFIPDEQTTEQILKRLKEYYGFTS
jgi:chemotaxis protein CheC